MFLVSACKFCEVEFLPFLVEPCWGEAHRALFSRRTWLSLSSASLMMLTLKAKSFKSSHSLQWVALLLAGTPIFTNVQAGYPVFGSCGFFHSLFFLFSLYSDDLLYGSDTSTDTFLFFERVILVVFSRMGVAFFCSHH